MSHFEPFQRWAETPNLAVLHTETTGLQGEIIELVLVDGQGRTLFLARIRPTGEIEPGAEAFHGIRKADLENLPAIDQYWPALSELLAHHQVVSYNAEFNVQVLATSLFAVMPQGWAYVGVDPLDFSPAYLPLRDLARSIGCVMEAYTPIYDNRQSFLNHLKPAKLAVACEREQVEATDLPGINTALGSALRTLRLVQAVASRAAAQGEPA